jgi:hypothetical protein
MGWQLAGAARAARVQVQVRYQEDVEDGPHDEEDGIGSARLHLVQVVLHGRDAGGERIGRAANLSPSSGGKSTLGYCS